jgi:hypothetical protein
LGQNIERLFRYGKLIELAATDAIEQCRAFDQIVAREREQAAFGHAIHRVSRTPNPLQETRDRAWGTELANQIDIADVDAEFERSGYDKRFELAMLETMLGVAPLLLGHAAMVRGNVIGAQALGQCAGRSLGHAARVHEYQGRAMIVDQPGELVMDQLPDFARHHGFER